VIVGGGLGWHFFQEAREFESTDNATLQGDVISVSSRISGTVASIEFADNQRVEAGQALVTLDPTDYQIALDQAEAALALSEQQSLAAESGIAFSSAQSSAAQTQAQGGYQLAATGVATAQAAVEVARGNLASAQARLEQARVQSDQAQLDLARARQLAEAGVVPTQFLDQAETTAKVSAAAVEAAAQEVAVQQDKLSQAQAGVEAAQAQVEQSRGAVQSAAATTKQTAVQEKQYEAALAQIDVARAAVDAARQRLSYTTISAPESGRIGRRAVQVGQQVSAGQPLLALVPDRLWVVANFKETQLANLRPGQPVTIKVDTFPGKVFAAHVDSLSPASGSMFALLPPENASGNFTKVVQRIPVKITFEPEALAGYEDLLRPGMSVIVKVKVR
jgi:membrane fusion protein (multidrug efflux system)